MPFWRLYYHIVWATRNRQPLIAPSVEADVHQAVRQSAGRHGVTIHAIGGTEDHIHLVVEAPPTLSLAETIGRIKGSSSYLINQRLHDRLEYAFYWQREYGIVSFAHAQLASVCRYVETQRERHVEGKLIPSLEPEQ